VLGWRGIDKSETLEGEMIVGQSGETSLKKRRIKLKDGRYMIFYTFEDEPAPSSEDTRAKRSEPKPKAQAEDERLV
jgi:hypothetical protein